MYAGPLEGGARAVVLFNRHTPFPLSSNLTVYWHWLGYPVEFDAQVRDLYDEKDLGTFAESFTALVEPHGVCVVRIAPETVLPNFDSWRPWHQSLDLLDPFEQPGFDMQ